MHKLSDKQWRVRRFCRADWDWYRSWFDDPELNRRLGPLDHEWLEHVLAETDGAQLVVEQDLTPTAVVGCVWGAPGFDHGITDLAVDPARRREGLGAVAVDAAIAWPGHRAGCGWLAFVEEDNAAAHAFFTSLGWSYLGIDDDRMHAFRRAPVSVSAPS